MTESPRPKSAAALGCVALLLMLVGVYFIFRFITDQVSSAILTGVLVFLASQVAQWTAGYFERSHNALIRSREHKARVYAESWPALFPPHSKSQQSSVAVSPELFLFASDEVLSEIARLANSSSPTSDAATSVMLAIRKDLGHSSDELTAIDVTRLFALPNPTPVPVAGPSRRRQKTAQ